MGFEPLVNQRLLPPTFPRYTQICTREKTFEHLEALITRMTKLLGVSQLSNAHDIIVSDVLVFY